LGISQSSSRKAIWGWYFFDWASQPYSTLLLTFIFGPYFAEVARNSYIEKGFSYEAAAAQAQSYWGWSLALVSLAVACLAPIFGAMADGSGRLMAWILGFSVLYVLGACGLWGLMPQDPNLLLAVGAFGLGFLGMEFATIFTNALLLRLAHPQDTGSASGSGFAFGYFGGVLALALMLLFFAENSTTGRTLIGLDPLLGLDASQREGTRFVGPFSAVWYMIFMVPFFAWQPKETARPREFVPLRKTLYKLVRLLVSLRHRQSLAAYLGSSLFYRDALNALYSFGGVYASGVLGWSITAIGVFGVVGALTASIACLIGGKLDRTYGPKFVIRVNIWALIAVCITLVFMDRNQFFGMTVAPDSGLVDVMFYICGAIIGGAGGMLQAASRTMMVRHVTENDAAQSFGLYALSGKVTSFLAPAAIALATILTGSPRLGITPLIALFLFGLILLHWVKEQGEQDFATV
jgi:UMF1 family MFS transporter